MNSQNIVMITGTDTGVGKTWTACALGRGLRQAGRRVLAIKPLETGCPEVPQASEDGVALAAATGQAEPVAALMRFRDPVASAEAADRENRPIDFAQLVQQILTYAVNADVVLVEGAGGILAPLTWQHNILDMAQALDARMLLVAADRLGTINHTLMSLRVLEMSGLETVGVVMTPPARADDSTGTNQASITRLHSLPRIHRVPRTSNPELMGRAMQVVVDWLLG